MEYVFLRIKGSHNTLSEKVSHGAKMSHKSYQREKTEKLEKSQKRRKYPQKRIPRHLLEQLNKIGKGHWKEGLIIALNKYDEIEKHPERIIMADVDKLMSDIRTYFGDNHYEHFDNFPSFMIAFMKSGVVTESMFKRFFGKRPEKIIDEFSGDDENAEELA